MFTSTRRRVPALRLIALTLTLCPAAAALAQPQQLDGQPIVHRVEMANERLEMVVNSSRILTLGQKIPKVQVNNPEMLAVTPLADNQVQISALMPGVTQVNLWSEEGRVYAVDVVVYGDARELAMMLKAHFPHSSLKVVPLKDSVVISGFVDQTDYVPLIQEIAQDYHPNVINLIKVGGVQQVLLKVKVMEVSRTKLRTLGHDFDWLTRGDFLTSVTAGAAGFVPIGSLTPGTTTNTTATYGLVSDNGSFFGFLEALRQNNLARLLADPTLVTVSGRPAFFNEGGEFPVLVPQSLGTVSIEYKKFGTQMDFVPIVLGNGKIRLEVRPRVSEIDPSRSVIVNGTEVPGLRVREVDTGVEMFPGQTLAIAGLIQHRTESSHRAVPFFGELPWVGSLFGRITEESNEIELLVLVTPYLVEPMDPHEVPPCGPGTFTTSPNDPELYGRRYLEVPKCCPDGSYGVPYGPYGPDGPAPDGVEVLPPGGAPADVPAEGGPAAMLGPQSTPGFGNPPFGGQSAAMSSGNRYHPQIGATPYAGAGPSPAASGGNETGFIGPIGYDVLE